MGFFYNYFLPVMQKIVNFHTINRMIMKKSILTLVFLMFAGAIFAQEQAKRGPFLTNGFWDNWFISAGVGANL